MYLILLAAHHWHPILIDMEDTCGDRDLLWYIWLSLWWWTWSCHRWRECGECLGWVCQGMHSYDPNWSNIITLVYFYYRSTLWCAPSKTKDGNLASICVRLYLMEAPEEVAHLPHPRLWRSHTPELQKPLLLWMCPSPTPMVPLIAAWGAAAAAPPLQRARSVQSPLLLTGPNQPWLPPPCPWLLLLPPVQESDHTRIWLVMTQHQL